MVKKQTATAAAPAPQPEPQPTDATAAIRARMAAIDKEIADITERVPIEMEVYSARMNERIAGLRRSQEELAALLPKTPATAPAEDPGPEI